VRFVIGAWIGACSACVLLAVAVAKLIARPAISPSDEAALHRMSAYCNLVRTAFEQDVTDLESEDPHRRDAAGDRFLEPRPLHSVHDYELCTPRAPKVDTNACWHAGAESPACLVKLARMVTSRIAITTDGRDALRRLHEYCSGVYSSIDTLALDYEIGESDTIRWAERDISEPLPDQSTLALRLCSRIQPDVGELQACRARRDSPCAARVLRGFVQRIYVPDTR
jgi:hypothetical protein